MWSGPSRTKRHAECGRRDTLPPPPECDTFLPPPLAPCRISVFCGSSLSAREECSRLSVFSCVSQYLCDGGCVPCTIWYSWQVTILGFDWVWPNWDKAQKLSEVEKYCPQNWLGPERMLLTSSIISLGPPPCFYISACLIAVVD